MRRPQWFWRRKTTRRSTQNNARNCRQQSRLRLPKRISWNSSGRTISSNYEHTILVGTYEYSFLMFPNFILLLPHSDREEHLLNDCEWKLRSTEQSCKAKLTAAETAKREALERAEITETEAHRQLDEVKHLRSYEAEVTQLRSLTTVQSESIVSMTKKLDDLKEELEEANQTVNDSLETVRKIKFQCEQYGPRKSILISFIICYLIIYCYLSTEK